MKIQEDLLKLNDKKKQDLYLKCKFTNKEKEQLIKGSASAFQTNLENLTEETYIKMQKAVEEDHEANKTKKPALQRLLIMKECLSNLRNISIQEKFIENGGS